MGLLEEWVLGSVNMECFQERSMYKKNRVWFLSFIWVYDCEQVN